MPLYLQSVFEKGELAQLARVSRLEAGRSPE